MKHVKNIIETPKDASSSTYANLRPQLSVKSDGLVETYRGLENAADTM
jgi:hypothetical protein